MAVITSFAQLAPAAVQIQNNTGVPAAIVMAVAANEGGIGANESELASKYNNFFGIKAASNPPGSNGSVSYLTHETINGVDTVIRDNFATFPDLQTGLNAFVAFLQVNSRYRNLVDASGHATESDPIAFARKLQADGYGTSPSLAQAYINLINSSGLQEALHAASNGVISSTNNPTTPSGSNTQPGNDTGGTTTSGTGGATTDTTGTTTNTSGLGIGQVDLGTIGGQLVTIPSGMVLAALAVVLLILGAILFLANNQTVKVEALKGVTSNPAVQTAAKVLP